MITNTAFEAHVDLLRHAQSQAAGGYGTTLPYAYDVLEGSNTDFDVAISQARALLILRKQQVWAMEEQLEILDKLIAEGGKEEYIQATEEILSK
jgi:hypothetical protein